MRSNATASSRLTRIAVNSIALAILTVSTAVSGAADTPCEEPSGRPRRVETQPPMTPEIPSAGIAYVALSEVGAVPEPPASLPRGFVLNSAAMTPPPPAPIPAPRISTAPMTPNEKFELFLRSAFMPPGPYAQSLFSGFFNEWRDKDDGRDSSAGDYFADSLTRAARSFAGSVTNKYFEKFLFATAFQQDPRYHRSGKTGTGARIGYAVSRIVVTQGDRGGSQFNASFILGGLTAATVSNAWQRTEKQTGKDTLRRWSTHLWLTALTNIVREFVAGQ